MKRNVIIATLMIATGAIYAQEIKPEYKGTFQIRPGFNMEITAEGQKLFVEATGQSKEEMEYINNEQYSIASINGVLDFKYAKNGNKLVVEMYGQKIHAPRLPLEKEESEHKEIDFNYDKAQSFAGEYILNQDVTASITVKEEGLFAQMTGQPEFQLFPFTNNKYFYKVVDAYLEFVQEEGDGSYVLIHQNGVIIQADKK